MFDIGFFELLVIGIVGLVVIGPERLPETARAVGLWLGRLKRSLRETRSELEKQLGADDIRRQLHNEEVMRSLEATRRQIQEAVQEGVIEDRPKPSARKGDYKEEQELPDHAHADDAPASSASVTPEVDATSEPDIKPETDASGASKAGDGEATHQTDAKRPPQA